MSEASQSETKVRKRPDLCMFFSKFHEAGLCGSSAIAIKLADEGLKTLVISTDPAHSLGDALMTDLSSGKVRILWFRLPKK